MDHLRKFAVTVVEPAPGRFQWKILESKAGPDLWEQVEAGKEDFSSYAEALARGNDAVMSYGDDPDVGPRADGEDEDADPVG